jgi:LPXTG-motif cell wall-anchored protein
MIRKILAATAALTLGLGGVLALAAPASAAEDCTTENTGWVTESPGPNWKQTDKRTVTDEEATDGSYTDWSAWAETQSGLLTEPTVPANTDTHEYRVTGPVSVGNGDGVAASDTRVWWVLRGWDLDGPPASDNIGWKAQPNLPNDNSQHSYPGENGLGNPYQPGENQGNGDWFRFTGTLTVAVPETFHDEWAVEERTREFVPGSDAVTHEEFKFEKTTCTEVPVDDPKDPPKADKPDAPKQPELPHTGGNLTAALVGLALAGVGGILTLLGYRRPSVV